MSWKCFLFLFSKKKEFMCNRTHGGALSREHYFLNGLLQPEYFHKIHCSFGLQFHYLSASLMLILNKTNTIIQFQSMNNHKIRIFRVKKKIVSTIFGCSSLNLHPKFFKWTEEKEIPISWRIWDLDWRRITECSLVNSSVSDDQFLTRRKLLF